MKTFNYIKLLPSILGFVLVLALQTSSIGQTLNCPDDINVSIQDATNCDTIVEWIAPIYLPAAISIVQISGPLSGSDFTPGNYSVAYQYTFPGQDPDTCSFDIHVFGVPAPSLGCGPVQISLDENCMAVLSPGMVLVDTTGISCLENYVVFILDENLNPITDTLTEEHIGNSYMYMVGLPNSAFSCMNTLTVEDKLAPQIVCQDDTLGCYDLGAAKLPSVTEACSGYTLLSLPEFTETLDCDTNYIGRVTRRYYAIDESGNSSDTCTQVILLKRVDLSGITYPANRSVLTNDPLSCSSGFPVDNNGNPMPSVTGVPTIDGVPIFPTPQFLCNANVQYVDVVAVDNGCLKRILRRWIITEWWCSNENVTAGFQTIEIVDKEGPVFSCPDDMSFSTSGHDCTATVNLPALNITDNCNTVDFVSVEYGGVSKIGNGGVFQVPVGVNTVVYTARDICGNESTCSFEVTVTDKRKPIAVCLQNTVTSLTHLGTSYITADMVDAGSFDDCKLQKIEIRRMTDNCGLGGNTEFGERVYFCCEDMGTDVMVVLRVTDSSGNWNECMVSVEVQNKIVPKITSCPSNQTINCTDFYDPNDLAASFGSISVSTQCNGNYTIDETSSINVSDCNTGTISRTMRLKSLTGAILGTCNQTITIINPAPFDGFTMITWPEDYASDNLCTMTGLDPELLAAPYKKPIYNEDACTLLGVSHEDEVFEFVNGEDACFKIIRHWAIIDWCQQTSPGTYKVWKKDQILKVTNSIAPQFTAACSDTLIETYDCLGADLTLSNAATDDCTSEAGLEWNYKIDLNNDNVYDATGVTNVVSGHYPLGVHRIVWTVRDGCGQKSSCTEFFEIRTLKAPTPIAHHGLSASLVAMDTDNDGVLDTEMVMLEPSFFNKNSNHPCGDIALRLSFSADVNDVIRVFGCNELGEQDIQLWVTDIHGNQSHVNTYVIIEDTNNTHICPENSSFTISGRMFTEDQNPIPTVHVMKMEGDQEVESMTDQDGVFNFQDVSQGIDLMIEPNKLHNDNEGVSTLDLLLIQRHILKLRKLDSPYKLIAADVNNDDRINGADLIMLRKLILSKIDDLGQDNSWKFIDTRYEFEDAEHPWDEDYRQTRSIEYMYGDKVVDFYGVKMGDVDNSATYFNSNNLDERNTVSIDMEDQKVIANTSVYVPVAIQNEDVIKGFQFSMALEGLQFVGVESANIGIQNFSVDSRTNTLKCSWNDLNSENESLQFVLVFESSLDGQLANMINLDNALQAALYTGESLTTIGLNLSIEGLPEAKIIPVTNANLKNTPNPFSGMTEVSFVLDKDQLATISFYDVSGRLIEQNKAVFTVGLNKYIFDADVHGVTGLVYVKLQTVDQTYVKKMMITK